MKYLSKFTLVFVFGSVGLFAQAPDTAWTRTYGGSGEDIGKWVHETSDGGYIIVGCTDSYGAGAVDAYLVRTDSAGNELWHSTIGGPMDEWIESACETADGGYVLTGTAYSYDPYWASNDVYLAKADANGNEVWHKIIRCDPDSSGTQEWAYSVKETSDGGYIIAGFRNNYDQDTLTQAYLVKTDASGNKLWDKLFGGSEPDWANSVAQTSDGGYILTGGTESFGAGLRDVYLIKTDADGNETWSKTFGGEGYDEGYSVCETSDGGYIIAGFINSLDIYLIKTEASGNEVWSKTFGGTDYETAYSVQQTSDGGYMVAGVTASYGAGVDDVYLIKTDANGSEVWSKTFGGPNDDIGYSVQQASDGRYIVAGETQSYGTGSSAVYLIKIKPEGSGIEEEITTGLFSLSPADPNPFTTKTTIRYELVNETNVNVSICNMLGQKVKDLYSGRQSPGTHYVTWNGMGKAEKLPSGIYFLKIKAGGKEASTKIMLLR